ncbi:MAG: hypothetical protein ACI89J_003452, partial [Hyphomicrobiaceae bacterium]
CKGTCAACQSKKISTASAVIMLIKQTHNCASPIKKRPILGTQKA